jgi:RNA polymerase sigma-B factor
VCVPVLPRTGGSLPPHDLVASHQALARSLARRFANRGEDLDDLTQVAMLGLVKAASRFDPNLDIRFSTFATATITGELKRHFRDRRWGLHVSRSAQERYLLIRQATDWARDDLGRSPTIAEIAEKAGVTVEAVLEAQELIGAFHVESIDAPDDDTAPTAQPSSIDSGYATAESRIMLQSLLDRLSERDRQIVNLRFVDELTQSQIAAHLSMSQMQVSRLLHRILQSLREWSATSSTDARQPDYGWS